MISEEEIQKLCNQALALGQDHVLLEAIKRNELHPVMAAFGLWRNEDNEFNVQDFHFSKIKSRQSSIVNRKS